MNDTGSSFAFLAHHGPLYLRLAVVAERALALDPNLTLVKLRQLSEAFARHAAARADEPQRGRRGRPARTADPELFAAKPAAPRATNGHGAEAEEGGPVDLVVAAFQLTPRLTATSIGSNVRPQASTSVL